MRRSFVPVVIAVVFGASIIQAQGTTAAPPAQNPPAAAAPQAAPAVDPLKFTVDEAAVVIQVKPGMGADFEAGFSDLLKTLAASTKPELVAHGASMKLYKADLPIPADQPTIYLLKVTGSSKELSYNYGLIIYYSGKPQGTAYSGIYEKQEDATVVYNKLAAAIGQMNPWPLSKIGG